MFARHRKIVSLSLISLDLPLQSSVRTTATLYQKGGDRCHILFSDPLHADNPTEGNALDGAETLNEGDRRPDSLGLSPLSPNKSPLETLPNRHLWLEISPYRAILTMQGNGGFSYRHLWEEGVYGTSRYWVQTSKNRPHDQVRRSYEMKGKGIPKAFRLEYELWTQKLSMGRYVLNLDVH